jgi:hypothetical protein
MKEPCVFEVMWYGCQVAFVIGVVLCSDNMSTRSSKFVVVRGHAHSSYGLPRLVMNVAVTPLSHIHPVHGRCRA